MYQYEDTCSDLTKVNIQRATQHVQSIRILKEKQEQYIRNQDELRIIRDQKEYQLKKLQKFEQENEDKITEYNVFNSDIEALQVQINNFLGMTQEMEIELENLEDEHDYIKKQNQMNSGYLVNTDQIGFNN